MSNYRQRQNKNLKISMVAIVIGIVILVAVFFTGWNLNSGKKLSEYGMTVYDDIPAYQFGYNTTEIQFEEGELKFLRRASQNKRDETIYNLIINPYEVGDISGFREVQMNPGTTIESIELTGTQYIYYIVADGRVVDHEVVNKRSEYGVFYIREPYMPYDDVFNINSFILIDEKAYQIGVVNDTVMITPV